MNYPPRNQEDERYAIKQGIAWALAFDALLLLVLWLIWEGMR